MRIRLSFLVTRHPYSTLTLRNPSGWSVIFFLFVAHWMQLLYLKNPMGKGQIFWPLLSPKQTQCVCIVLSLQKFKKKCHTEGTKSNGAALSKGFEQYHQLRNFFFLILRRCVTLQLLQQYIFCNSVLTFPLFCKGLLS